MHKTRFFNTNLDYLTSEWPETQNVKSVAHFDMFQALGTLGRFKIDKKWSIT